MPRHVAPPMEAPFDRMVTASFDSTGASNRSVEPLPANSYHWRWWGFAIKPRQRLLPATPVLESELAGGSSDRLEIDTVMVTFDERIRLSRFPEPEGSRSKILQPADYLAASESAVQVVSAARQSQFDRFARELARDPDGRVLERFWLAPVLRIRVRRVELARLAKLPGVAYIQRDRVRARLPAKAGSVSYAIEGRQWIASDPYFDLGLEACRVGLLDTGILASHELFRGTPPTIGEKRDCVGGDAQCQGPRSGDIGGGHGTASAAILAARAPGHPESRGVSGSIVDCFRVYEHCGCGDSTMVVLDIGAAERGMATAARLDRVIVAEMQNYAPAAAGIGIAADNAYRTGAVVIAANGNNGGPKSNPGTIGIPASSRLAIGAGAFEVKNGNQAGQQSWGTFPDGRVKPEVTAPTSCWTASNESDSAMGNLSETSGSTPFVAGAAVLLRSWLAWAAGSAVDPGQVYAQLILSASNNGPFDNATSEGAGKLHLPSQGWGSFGKIQIDNRAYECEIPIRVRDPRLARLVAAAWWPEELITHKGRPVDSHNNIDLEIVDPGGTSRASSLSVGGVFERTTVDSSLTPGTWHLRIRGVTLRHPPQTVYWSVAQVRARARK